MIAGLEQVDEGEIRIDGADVTDLRNGVSSEWFFRITRSFRISLPPALKMLRMPCVFVGGPGRKLPHASMRCSIWVHLSDAARKYPHELSGGMQQRVALARALAISPSLLLPDEPLSALDAAIRESLRAELRRLHRQLDVTVIYVTHDQAEAMALSDTVVVMKKERSVNPASSGALQLPTTRFTAVSFVGASNRHETMVERFDGNGGAVGGRGSSVDIRTRTRGQPGDCDLETGDRFAVAVFGHNANGVAGRH